MKKDQIKVYNMPFDKRHKSKRLVDGPDRAPARSYFKSVGYGTEDLKKPLVMMQ